MLASILNRAWSACICHQVQVHVGSHLWQPCSNMLFLLWHCMGFGSRRLFAGLLLAIRPY